jgi:lysine 2,3-aminomutase
MSDTKISTPETKAARPTWKPAGRVHAGEQPFTYPLKREFVEPDWRRLPGYKDVTQEEWETALWQRRHTVKNLKEFKAVFGDLVPESLMANVERDIRERATMSILIPPHMLNTMDDKDLWNDPVRRYMLPAFEDRHPEWPSHPKASRDSLHEADMWAVEGLTHRYPTKVLAELLSTCPQYCGHCTRMDLVGNDVPQVVKLKFQIPQKDRYEQMLQYLRVTPSVRDVVVSGGDIANTPIAALESFVSQLMDIPTSRHTPCDQRADRHSTALSATGSPRRAGTAGEEGPRTWSQYRHHARKLRQQVPLVRRRCRPAGLGYRDVRNQGVLRAA